MSMITRGFWQLEGISDASLVGGLHQLARQAAGVEAQIVAHLAELDTRRLHLRAGQSLWEYCLGELGFSESQAHYRIAAARAAQRFPIIFELLEGRSLHLTSVALVSQHLSNENHVELLREAHGLTKRKLLELLARRFPKPNVPSTIRKLPPRSRELAAGPTGTLAPLSEQSFRLQLNIDATLKEDLELACDLMSHANPTRDLAVVVGRGVRELIRTLRKERFALTDRPPKPEQRLVSEKGATPSNDDTPSACRSRSTPGSSRSHVPNSVRREVATRDGVRCSYVGSNGQRCQVRAFLQLHHEHAWAKGGPDCASNLRLLCASHNQLLAEDDFGREHVDKAIAVRRWQTG